MNTKLFRQIAVSTGLILSGISQAQASAYVFTDLGTLGGARSRANAINASGQVVGWSETASGEQRATLWSGGTVIDLGTLGGASEANSINASGQVVGQSSGRATLWEAGTVTDLGTLGGMYSAAYGINNNGQVAGVSSTVGAETPAVLWAGGTIIHLGTLGGLGSTAYAINASGQMAGISYSHAVLWNGTVITDLGSLNGYTNSSALGINDSGQVVGFSDTGIGRYRATLWSGNTVTDLGSLGGQYLYSYAQGINNRSQVVGVSYPADGGFLHATLWDGTTVIDLNSFLPTSLKDAGWILYVASGINDSGQIVGFAYNNLTQANHAYVLTPVPEPATYSMIGLGICLLGVAARRPKQSRVIAKVN